MSQMTTEVELKYWIDGQGNFQKLLNDLPPAEASFIQTNNYLDDAEGSLRKAKIMVRAREIKMPFGSPTSLNKPPVTIEAKRRISKADGLFISEERGQVMPLDDWQEIKGKSLPIPTDGPVFQWLAGIVPFGPLSIIGHTVNHRHQFRSNILTLELDCTQFPDGSEELELECETQQPEFARNFIETLFARLGIEGGPQREGKYARFLEKMGL